MATAQPPSINKAGLGELFSRLRFVLLAIIVYRIGNCEKRSVDSQLSHPPSDLIIFDVIVFSVVIFFF